MNKFKAIFLLALIIVCIVGLMTSKEETTVDTINENGIKTQSKIVLYFAKSKEDKLEKEYRYVDLDKIKEDMAGTIIEELIKGPNSEELVQRIPKGTKVNKIEIDKEKITVDFSKEFESEEDNEIYVLQKIYSVVNSLTEIKDINEVVITVEGAPYADKFRL